MKKIIITIIIIINNRKNKNKLKLIIKVINQIKIIKQMPIMSLYIITKKKITIIITIIIK